MGHRTQLLEAAKRLLEERGYARITARDLVAASGTNLASIGYHFGSKQGLLNAAIEAAFEEWADQLASVVMAEEHASPLERGLATWIGALETLPRRRPMLQAYVDALAQAQRDPRLQEQLAAHYRAARDRVARLVAESIARGSPDVTAPDEQTCRAIAGFVIAACDGFALQWLLAPDEAPSPESLRAGLATVWAASAQAARAGGSAS